MGMIIEGGHIAKLNNTAVVNIMDNLHIWEKKTKLSDARYTIGELSTVYLIEDAGSNTTSNTWRYSDSITIDNNGVISLAGTTSSTSISYYYADTKAPALSGKYAYNANNLNQGIWYFPSDTYEYKADYSTSSGSYVWYVRAKGCKLQGYAAEYSTERILSADEDTYNDIISETDSYTYIGKVSNSYSLFEFGSYLGTGLSGSSNPNTLTFSFIPKILILFSNNGEILLESSFNYVTTYAICSPLLLTSAYQKTTFLANTYPSGSTYYYGYIKRIDNTVYWYHEYSSTYQYNYSNTVYYYLAIG